MKYTQFLDNIHSNMTGSDIKARSNCYGFTIVETVDSIFIDGIHTDLTNLEEAKQYIKNQLVQESIVNQIRTEELSLNTVADIITRHHDIRVTDTLIESYIDLASSKIFTIDPVVKDIKTKNKLDEVLEDHYEFILEDGSKILVSNEMLQLINNTLGKHTDVIEHMRESKDNFFHVLELIHTEE